MGQIGFSYTGLLFLLMLCIPNIRWIRKMPQGYSAETENKILRLFERAGEGMTCFCVLFFSDFNWRPWTAWSWWLAAALFFMLLYELWWIRYFRSERKMSDFYSSLLGIPVAGATLPVIAFFCLGLYGKVIWMLIAAGILGIGHIGIHLQHRGEI